MIIKGIDIEGFGKLVNRKFEFKEGFNLVSGNNEEGKSTIMAFILMMFYGKSGSGKSADLLKNPRKKYIPWSGAPMSGAIEFETNGTEYRIHKSFKKSASSDKTTIHNMSTGESYSLPPSDEAGAVFFNMELGEFERSIFIGQTGGFSSDASGDGLAMRIANLSVSGDEKISQKTVVDRLLSAKEELVSKSGKKGALVDAENRLESLNFKHHELTGQLKKQYALSHEISCLESEIAALELRIKGIENAQKVTGAKKDLNTYRLLKEKTIQLRLAKEHLSDFNVSISDISDIINKCRQLKKDISDITITNQNTSANSAPTISDGELALLTDISTAVSALEADIELLNTEIKPAMALYENEKEAVLKKQKAKGYAYLLTAIISAVAFFITGVLVYPVAFSGLLLSFLCVALFVKSSMCASSEVVKDSGVLSAKKRVEALLHMLHSYESASELVNPNSIDLFIRKQLDEKKAALSEKLGSYGCSSLDELIQKKESAEKVLCQNQASVNMLKEKFVFLIAQVTHVDSFGDALTEYTSLNDELSRLEDLSRYIATVSDTSGITNTSPEFIDSEITRLDNFIRQNQADVVLDGNVQATEAELLKKRSAMNELLSRMHQPDMDINELNSEIAEKKSIVASLKERYESLCIAEEIMNEAISETNRGLGTYLNRRTGEYLNLMSKGRYSDVLVSRDLSVEARSDSDSGYHEWKYLSNGAIDRIYLALRLAATDIIAEGHETLPVFLDDILSQYDDENCISTMEFLKEYLNKGNSASQILLFTCHKHIADMAKNIIQDLNEITL